MSGARTFAIEFLKRHLPPSGNILDVATGDGVIARIARDHTKAMLVAVDVNAEKIPKETGFHVRDVTWIPWIWAGDGAFDTVISTYAMHTLGPRESAVWSEVGRVLRPGGAFLVTSNHAVDAPRLVTARRDPTKLDNRTTFRTLGLASGLRLVHMEFAVYTPTDYRLVADAPDLLPEANACAAVFMKDLEQYRSTYRES